MKIIDLFEGYYKRLDIERQEGRENVKTSATKNSEPEMDRYVFELKYGSNGYYATTFAVSKAKAESNVFYMLKKYLKDNHPQYFRDVALIKKDIEIKDISSIDPYLARQKRMTLTIIDGREYI